MTPTFPALSFIFFLFLFHLLHTSSTQVCSFDYWQLFTYKFVSKMTNSRNLSLLNSRLLERTCRFKLLFFSFCVICSRILHKNEMFYENFQFSRTIYEIDYFYDFVYLINQNFEMSNMFLDYLLAPPLADLCKP